MYDLELRFGLWKDVVRAYMYRHRSLNMGLRSGVQSGLQLCGIVVFPVWCPVEIPMS